MRIRCSQAFRLLSIRTWTPGIQASWRATRFHSQCPFTCTTTTMHQLNDTALRLSSSFFTNTSFVIDDELFVSPGNAVDDSHARQVAARSWDAFTSISIKRSFRWAMHSLTDVCESAQHEAQELSELALDENLEFFESQLVKNPGKHPDGSPVASIGLRSGVHFPKDIPPFSLSTPFHFCCVHRYHSWQALFVIFLDQKHLYEKLNSERPSFTCRSSSTKWRRRRDCRAHYN